MKLLVRNIQRKVSVDLEGFKREAEKAIRLLGLEDYEVSFLFVNDARSRQLNKQYRGKDRPTDVLSFPLYHNLKEIKKAKALGEVLLGDVVINLHMCQRLSQEEGVSMDRLIRRMAVHGLLHLIGYDHERSPSEARKMRRKEEELLDALEEMD